MSDNRQEQLQLLITLPPELVEQIAQHAAELALKQLGEQTITASPYLTINEAAEYLRCKRQRVDDLLSRGRLRRVKEGRRTLILRAELEAYLAGGGRHPGQERLHTGRIGTTARRELSLSPSQATEGQR